MRRVRGSITWTDKEWIARDIALKTVMKHKNPTSTMILDAMKVHFGNTIDHTFSRALLFKIAAVEFRKCNGKFLDFYHPPKSKNRQEIRWVLRDRSQVKDAIAHWRE